MGERGTGLVRAGAAVLAAALACASPDAAPAQSMLTPATGSCAEPLRAERMAIFDFVWKQVRDLYYDASLNGVDWSAVGAEYRPRICAVSSEAEFHKLLRAMVAELRDAHTRVLTPDQAKDRRATTSTTAGAVLFEVEGRPVLFDVIEGSPAAEAGLRRGMRVLEVNGAPVAEALRRSRQEVGRSSSDRAELLLAYRNLVSGRAGEPLRLRVSGADGVPRDVELSRRALPAAPRFEARLLASGHLYVRFSHFRRPVARRFAAALAEHPNARGVVLDLRSNPGGDGKEGARLIAPLLDRPTLVARLATRTGKPPSALLGLVKLPLRLTAGREGRQLFSGPVAILVNEGTASTSEVIAASLQERGRAKIVGTRSCGCALGVLRYRPLKNGGALAISEVGLLSGLGRRIEGEGVAPDVAVQPRLADFSEGRDRGVEEAVELLDRPAARPGS